MDIMKLIQDVLLILLPTILAFILGKLGIDADAVQRHRRLMDVADMMVLWAEDAFPDKPGPEQLKIVVTEMRRALIKGGYLDEEIDKAARAAYQKNFGELALNVAGE